MTVIANMTGIRHIRDRVAVRYTSDHLHGRLLEDPGSHSSSGEGCFRSPTDQSTVRRTGRWNKCRKNNSRDDQCHIVERWEPTRWSGRERSSDGWSKRTRQSRESTRINVSVQGTNQRCENHGLHQRLKWSWKERWRLVKENAAESRIIKGQRLCRRHKSLSWKPWSTSLSASPSAGCRCTLLPSLRKYR